MKTLSICLSSLILLGLSAIAGDSNLTITTWNIEHLGTVGRGFGGGYGGFGNGSVPPLGKELPKRSEAQLEQLADLIQTELGSDVIALQEIGITGRSRGKSLSHPLRSVISHLAKSGADWSYYLPPLDETPADDAEDNTFLGFAWNKDRLRLLNAFEMPFPDLILAGKDVFERPPLIGYFESIRTDGRTGNDFVVVNVHLASGQDHDENHLIAMTLIEHGLNSALAKRGVRENERIILGDLNDNPLRLDSGGDPKYSPALYAHMKFKGYHHALPANPRTTRLSSRFDSLIDHIFVSQGLLPELVTAEAVLFAPYDFDGHTKEWAAWRTSFSDHLPLSIQIRVTSDNDTDFFE